MEYEAKYFLAMRFVRFAMIRLASAINLLKEFDKCITSQKFCTQMEYTGPFLLGLQLNILGQRRRLRVASGVTAPGPVLEGAPRFRPKGVLLTLSSYILR